MDEQSLRNLLGSLDNEDLSEHDFVTCSNALLELDVKNVDLREDLRILLQYKLARYAMLHLTGPLKPPDQWSESVDRIQDLFQRLQGQPTGGDSFSVNDETLLLFKLIHNEVWCLERVERFQGIPLKEVAFCLALFLLVFKLEDDFRVYRLVLNRSNVMDFLEAVVMVLREIKLKGAMDPSDYNSLVSKKHRKAFKSLVKIYAILKRLYYMQNIQRDISAIIENDVDEAIQETSMCRLLEKFKLYAELLTIPLDLKEHSMAYVSVQESYLKRDEPEEPLKFYQTFYQRLPILESIFKIGIFLQVHSLYRHFLQIARGCTAEKLRLLLNFVDLISIESDHREMLCQITHFYEKLEKHVYLQSMQDLQENLQQKLILLRDMKTLQISSIYFSNTSDINRIGKMVHLDLQCNPTKLVKLAFELWKTIQPEAIIFDLLEPKFKSSNIVQQIETNTSESESESENQSELDIVIKMDKLLQNIQEDVFETYASTLKSFLEQFNCETVQKLVLNHSSIPPNVVMALNYTQAVFYDYLETCQKISDTFDLVLQGFGVFCSKVYHDFLKDENPNFLTIAQNKKLTCLINALILAEICFPKISLQKRRFPERLKDIRIEGFSWVQQQKELLQAALRLDLERFCECFKTRSVLKGKFLYQLSTTGSSKYYDLATILACNFSNQPNDLYFQILSEINCDLMEIYHSKEFQIQLALDLDHFEKAFKLLPKNVKKFPNRIFSWNHFTKKLITAGMDPKIWSCETLSFVVNKLVSFINIASLKDLFNLRADFIPDKGLILKAISTGSEELLKILTNRSIEFDEKITLSALEKHFNHTHLIHALNLNKFFIEAIKSNNIETITHICKYDEMIAYADHALQISISYNRIKIFRYLLLKFPHLNLDLALFLAVLEKRWKLANILLERGANPHFRTNSLSFVVFGIPLVSAFQIAVLYQCLKFVKKCVSQVELNQDLNLLALAAASGSIRMVKHLLRVGFKVVFDSRVVQMALGWGNFDVLHEIVHNIQLNVLVDGKCFLNDWYNLIEKSKYICFLLSVINSQEFQLTENVEFKKFILQRKALYERMDANFSIEKLIIYSEKLEDDQVDILSIASEMQQILRSTDSTFQKQFNFEIFHNVLELYAFAETTIMVDSKYDENENLCKIICIDKPNFSFDSINERIIGDLKQSFRFQIYSCDLKIFNGDSDIQRFLKLQIDSISFFAELKSSNVIDQMPNEGRLQLAVGSGDVECTRELIAKIGLVDQRDLWMDPTLFYKVVDYDGKLIRKNEKMASILLDAGMPFWKTNPKTIQYLFGYALSKGQKDLAELVLKYELPDGMSEEQRVLRILQYGSIETLKFCLDLEIIKQPNIFVNISNALLELDARGVAIEEELLTFLLHRLASHGFDNFCGDPTTPKSSTEWLDSLKFVIKWSNELLSRYRCHDFLMIDDEFLFRLRMIHNQLHFIKDKIHLKKVPVKEVMFLLSIFISSMKDEEFEIYRMVLNNSIAMKVLKSIARQLEVFLNEFIRVSSAMKTIINENQCRNRSFLEDAWMKDSSLPNLSDNVWNKITSKKSSNQSIKDLIDDIFGNESIDFSPKESGKSKKMNKFTTKYYLRVRQMYSLNKVYAILSNFSATNCSKEILAASMKRFVQIFGESIKNTANSMNFPAKLNKILTQQLSAYVKFNQQTRDITCHDFPLAKKYFSTEDQFAYYQISFRYLEVVKITMSILLICTTFDFTRCLFGSLRSCKSIESVQSLIRFVGKQSRVLPFQEQLLTDIKKYHKGVESLLDETPIPELVKSSQEALERLKINHNRRTGVINLLETMIISKFYYKYHELQVASFSAPSIEIFHRMLQMNLNHSSHGYLPHIHNEWKILMSDLDLVAAKLPEHESSTLAKVQYDFEINQKIAQDHHCRAEVSRICTFFVEESEISDSEKDQLELQLYQKLQGTKGRGYFGNIFAIDAKVQAIGQVFKKRNVENFDQKVKDLRERDVAELKAIFTGIQRSILRALELHKCNTIDDMIVNMGNLPVEFVLAIEYWMLELCEILITTKQFQDNYHTIKQGVQMICGRNFRNYLAHDSLSYDLLTNSSRTKVLVNALVMATNDWKIFGVVQMEDLSNLKDAKSEGLSWIRAQEDLKQSVLTLDLAGVNSSMDQGALLSGTYWESPGRYGDLRSWNLSELLLNKQYELFSHQNTQLRSIFTMLSPETPGKWNELSSSKMKIEPAMSNGHFQNALNYADCTWAELLKKIEYKFNVKLFLGDLFKFLEESEDTSNMFEILIRWGPELLYVLLAIGSQKLINYILERIPKARDYAQQHAIIARRNSPEYLIKLIPIGEAEPAHLTAAAICDNLPAFTQLLQTRNITHSQELENTLLVCSKFGRSEMIRLLLKRFPALLNAIDSALKTASDFRRWKAALILLDQGANPWLKDDLKQHSSADLAVGYGCLKILSKFLKVTPQNTSGIITLAAVNGSGRMMRALINAGLDVCQDQRALSAASTNTTDKKMLSFVESRIFNVDIPKGLDPYLSKWVIVLQKLKFQKYFDSTGASDTGELAMCLSIDHDLFRRVLNKLDSLRAVEVLGFNESNKEHLIKQYATMQNNIFQMFKTDRQQVDSQLSFLKIIHKKASILNSILNSQNTTGQTILHHLPASIPFDIFEQLISRGADLSIQDHQGKSVLFTLLQQTIPWSTLQQIFNHAARTNPNLLKVETHTGTSLLAEAASMCRLEAVQFLLDHGADQSIQNQDGHFPLYNAAMFRSIPIVKALLAQDPSVVNFRMAGNGKTALFVAAELNYAEMVQLLLDSGAHCTLRDSEGFTVVAKAVAHGCRDSLKVLLEHGKRYGIDLVNRVDPLNRTALHVGLLKDTVDTFRIVVESLVGGPIDDGLSPESLIKLTNIFKRSRILTAATLSGSNKIVAYLNEVIAVYKRLTNEDLNIGGLHDLPDFFQDMLQFGGIIKNANGLLTGEIPNQEILNNISKIKRDLEQMLQNTNMSD